MSSRYEVFWLAIAYRDLQAIFDYIEPEAPSAARRLVDRIVEHAQSLETFPLRGRLVPELARYKLESFRELIISPFRLIYRVEPDRVIVYGVFDGRRNLDEILPNRVLFPEP